MYYPEGMKARVSHVQPIEPHRILTPTRDSNQESPGPQSREETTILPLQCKLPQWDLGRAPAVYDLDVIHSEKGNIWCYINHYSLTIF